MIRDILCMLLGHKYSALESQSTMDWTMYRWTCRRCRRRFTYPVQHAREHP